MAAAQRAGTHRRAMRAGGARALNADRGDLDRRAFAYVSADRASPVRAGRQSALGVEVPHDVAAGDAARGTFRAGGIHCGRERSARERCPGPPHLQPLRAFLPAAFDRRVAAACARGAGRNVAGGAAADHGLRAEAALPPQAAEVLDVKPGLSGLWQIRGRSRLTYEQRRDLDLALVRNRSLKLYFQILLWTLPEIWSGRNAW